MKDEDYYKILDGLINYCSYAERCLQDVKKKMRPLDLSSDEQERMVDHLLEHDIVDEKRYAFSFAFGKLRYNKWGKIKIRSHLKGKWISDQHIHFAFNQLESDEYTSVLDHVLRYKYEKVKDDAEAFSKTIRHAQSKGFELGLSIELLKSIAAEED